MQFSHDEAKLIAGYILAQYEYERQITRRLLEAVPDGKGDYCPHERSMCALTLAWHIAASEKFFLDGICSGEFKSGDPDIPAHIKTGKDVVAWYDSNLPASIETAKELPGECLTRVIDFFGAFQLSALDYLSLMMKHAIHHRGQLSAYLRPMGAKVPGIYGPSGDK